MTSLDRLLEVLPVLASLQVPGSPVYGFLDAVAREEGAKRFGPESIGSQSFGPFGSLSFPYHRMGAIDSVDLFGLDELILFAFYWANRKRYSRAVDIGANIGLHSVVLDRCGFEVRSFEPDPEHFAHLVENLRRNGCERVLPSKSAVSSDTGQAEFVRVLGNTTSSHLAGSKANPYGAFERFPVDLTAIGPLMAWADLVKMDAEGHERQIVCATAASDWTTVDMVLEIGSRENARHVFNHAKQIGLSLFAQKIGWEKVESPAEMPESYRDGSLFVTARSRRPWSS